MTVAPILLSANLEEKTYEVKDKNNIMIHILNQKTFTSL